jgi:hypothetical protein
MTDEQLRNDLIQINVSAITDVQKKHGRDMAAIYSRAMISAAAFMLKLLIGSKATAMELYVIADMYAVDE